MKTLFESRFIIDGVPMDLTPAQMLGDGREVDANAPEIVDETLDPPVGGKQYDESKTEEYLALVKKTGRRVQLPFAEQYSRSRLYKALLDAMFCDGYFALDNLSLEGYWKWKESGLGSMAALYGSVRAVSETAEYLDLPIRSYDCKEGEPSLEIKVKDSVGDTIRETLVPDAESWILYVPFDTESFRLGGSLLAQGLGYGGGTAPSIDDADYFIDCFEVCRELVEDKVALSGVTVCDGGLLAALDRMTRDGVGADIDLSDLRRAYPDSDVTRLLFSEIPGALIQIRDDDFDYVDAELLLQDVMFFPLGHPLVGSSEVKLRSTQKTAIGSILESLIR